MRRIQSRRGTEQGGVGHTSRSKTNFGFPKWRRPHVPPPKTMLSVLSWRGRKFVLGKRGTNFATSIVFGRVVRRIRSQVFRGRRTVKLTSSFPNGATTPTKTMLKVLSLRDRNMFLAKRGTDFAPSFVWVCMVEGGPAHPKLSFGGGCRHEERVTAGRSLTTTNPQERTQRPSSRASPVEPHGREPHPRLRRDIN